MFTLVKCYDIIFLHTRRQIVMKKKIDFLLISKVIKLVSFLIIAVCFLCMSSSAITMVSGVTTKAYGPAYSFIFGNYSRNLHILLLSKSGELNELAIEFTSEGMNVELNENIKRNIETVLYKLYTGGHGAIVIERNGNEQYL